MGGAVSRDEPDGDGDGVKAKSEVHSAFASLVVPAAAPKNRDDFEDLDLDDADEARNLPDDEVGGEGEGDMDDLTQCSVCLDKYPLGAFPTDKHGKRKGKMCTECCTGSESMQRLLRFAWQEEYKVRYAKFKSEKALWRKTCLGFKSNPENRKGKRTFQRSQTTLANVKKKAKKKRRLRVKKPFTMDGFFSHFQKPKNGGYTSKQCQEKWDELYNDKSTKRDNDGVVEGVSGNLQLYAEVGNQEISESESEDAKVLNDEHRAGKAGFTDDDLTDWWMKGEVGDSKKVDALVAYQLADSLDKRLGFPLMERASAAGSEPSGAQASKTDKGSADATSTQGTTKAEQMEVLKWKRDKTKKIAAAKAVMEEDVRKIKTEMEGLFEVIAKARAAVPPF